MLELKVLVVEGLAAENGGASGAIAVEEVAALDHEGRDLVGVLEGPGVGAHVKQGKWGL